MKTRYVALEKAINLIVRCLFKYQLLFQIWDCLFRVNRVPMNFSKSRFRKCFLCCFWWISLNTSLEIYFGWRVTFDTSVILYRIHLGFKFKKQSFRLFRGLCQILSLFVKKVCFSVLVLNSIEVKDSRFINAEQCHLMVAISFLFRI